jgi:hypothetical protein
VADITWEDGSVPMSLGSPRPDPANRLFDVTPKYEHVGPIKTAMTQARHTFTFSEYYTLAFTIKHLSPAQWEDALALQRWLTIGETVTLNTDDLDSNSYSGLQIAPGTTVDIANDDDERQHFSFSCTLMDTTPIVVNYDG